MAYDLERFSAGTLDIGIQSRTMDFQDSLTLQIGVYNMSQGIQQGLGPRPGMSIIPGQADTETPTGTRFPGLRGSEGVPAQGFTARRKVLGVYALKLPDPNDVTQKITTYAWLVTTVVSAVEYFDIVLTSTYTSSAYESISTNIADGFGFTSYGTATSLNYFAEGFVPVSASRAAALRAFLQYQGGNFANSVIMSVTGPNVPMQWVIGEATATGGATTAPSAGFHKVSSILDPSAAATVFAAGVPSEYNQQNFTTTPRSMKIFALGSNGSLNIQYSVYLPAVTTTIFKKDIFGAGTVTLDLSTVTATKDSAGVTYSATKAVLVNDPVSVSNSSYKAILAAAKNPLACIFQDSYRGENTGNNGKTNQWYDLTQNSFQPRSVSSQYTQEGISTKTAFSAWPAFVRGTTMVTAHSIALGAANSGVLRAYSTYEFTYSLYNKRLNFETNVGVPVKIQTGADDFVALQLWSPTSNTVYADYWNGRYNSLPALFASFSDQASGDTNYQNFMNQLQYRFYYREEGTFEWLPALYMDVAQYWFYPFGAQIMACVGAIAALPGGQPGGFNDYSPLAKDNYTCVLQYKDRAFWFSDKQINFSLRNNIFAYPGRNSISAVAGEFKGGLVHNYPGQAEQTSRMIVFGTRETYVARFTGAKQQANVQVSADTSAVFDIDGSDLVIDPWTSVTAFSSRAAVVGEGLLYWWGPQGVFRDDGVQTPTRISTDIEPDIFTLYDPNKTDQVVANYNNQTKEVEWIFTPKTAASDGEVNVSLIYNTVSGNWTKGKYKQQVDWLQSVNVETNIGTAGYRGVIGTRLNAAATTQRAYYFDQRNRSGDMAPTRDFVVKTVATPSAGVRRLTLAAGYDATNFATIAVGDYIGLQQTNSYSSLTASDLVATVAAINTGSGTLDINLPTGATLATGSLTYSQYFPFWQRTPAGAGLNAIPYSMPTAYWVPKGVNAYYFWLYVYLLAKMTLWKTDLSALGWTLGYRTPTADNIITDQIPFLNNSDGNFQVYHPLRPGNDNMEGQGLKLVVSGYHIGHEWVLQYLEAHGTPIRGDTLKRFEG